jgi:conjugal transfer pilus assembly protein TraV
MTYRSAMTAAAVAAALSGCASFSGLDAESTFACKAPEGVTCQSVSGIYSNSMQNNLPALRPKHEKGEPAETPAPPAGPRPGLPYQQNGGQAQPVSDGGKVSPQAMAAPTSGMPVRTPERILRVWLAPFEDQEGDLHDQKYFYVTVQTGSWMIEANRVNIRQQFQQIFPLSPRSRRQEQDEPQARPSPAAQAQQTLAVSPVQQPAAPDGSGDQ